MLPDATLLLRYATARDAEAFAELVHRHAGLVFGVCRRICGNAADAEEVAQDCFLQLARHADRIRSSLPAWLHTVAVHAAVRACQARTARRQEVIDTEVVATDAAADGVAWRELVPHIDKALGGLPAEQREALVLRYLEDRTQEEIAQLMGLSQPTVSRRLNDGIAALRKALGPLSAEALPVLLVLPPPSLIANLGRMGMAGVGSPATSTGSAGSHAWTVTSAVKVAAASVLVATAALAYSSWTASTPGPSKGAPPAAAPAVKSATDSSVLVTGWQLQDAAKVAQTGEKLSEVSCPTTNWYKATVPGTILTTLVDNKVYPEPLYGENNRPDRIPETLCRTDWWYRTTFTVPEAYRDKKIWLNFNGINYAAEVWINGRQAGLIRGAFTRGIFDVTSMVNPGKEAALAVRISPQPNPGDPAEHTVGAGNGPIGGIAGVDSPTFVCTIGWDWLPGIRDRNTGIWQKVFLSATGPVMLKDPHVVTDLPLPRTDSAAVTVQATLRNVTGQPQKGVLKGGFDQVTFEKPIELPAWSAETVTFDPKDFPQLQVKNPKLWWPNGLGEPNRYSLHLSFDLNGKVSDAQDVSFGVRKFSYDIPGTDKLALSVNGVRVFCKGGNWGMDEALKRVPRERLEAQVRMHRDANYNMIRNWGGMSTNDDLYDLCDQYGIMLWDEFFLLTRNPREPDLYLANVRDKVLRVRNHPSIAVWCGRNEADPPRYINEALRFLLTDLDGTRCYQPNSGDGRGVNSGGPYEWQPPIDLFRFSEHRDFFKPETFKTELGALSIPTLESIQGMMPEKDWYSINDDWAEHDFMAGKGREYPGIMTERYGKIANLADFVRKGQMMTHETYRAMYEGRMGRMFQPTQGLLTWMSHPGQPSFVWQIYHYDLEPNAAFFAVKKACEQIHIQFSEDGAGAVQVLNHLPTALTGAKATVTLYNLDGTSPHRQEFAVSAAPLAVTSLGAVAWPAGLSPVHFMKLELRGADGKLISDNFIWRGAATRPNDLRALETLPIATLDAKVIRRTVDGKLLLDVTLRNPGPQIALMAHLQLRRKTSGERVLPVFYSDNYLSFAPNEERSVTIEASQADLKDDQPLILVDGWNIAVKPGTDIALNTKAQVSAMPQNGFGFAQPKLEARDEYHLSCGGFTHDGFLGDPGYLEGVPGWLCDYDIDTKVPLAAPESIYKTLRWGACVYELPLKPKPGQTYTVRLHFAEWCEQEPNKRVFDVIINGKTVLTDFDTFKEAGCKYKAVVRQFTDIAPDAQGRIVVDLRKVKIGTPQISGIEVLK